MTIYPAKNHRGRYTGSWTVEVMRKGERTRATAPDFVSAEQIERALKAGRGVPKDLVTFQALKRQATMARRAAYNLGRLEVEAGRRLIGRKDEKQSTQRLAAMVRLLGPETPVDAIRYGDLEKAGNALAATGLKGDTVNRYMAAISGALKWAYRNEIIDRVPPKPWRPKGRGRIAFVPESADTSIYRWLVEQGRQDVALVYAVLVTTGLRVGELLSLEASEVGAGWLRLSDTKNSDARDVPVATRLSEALVDALRRNALPSYQRIFDSFVEASEALQIGVRITPHVLRHTAATRLNGAGVTTATIKKFLGHRDMRTTLQYAHADNSAVGAAGRLLDGPGKPW